MDEEQHHRHQRHRHKSPRHHSEGNHHDDHHHEQKHRHHHKHQQQQQHHQQEKDPERRTVIIAMDGSRHSFYAFDWYMGHLHTANTDVIVAHSSGHHSKPFSHVQNLMPSVLATDTSVMSRLVHEEEEVNQIVAQIKGKLTQAGVRGKLLRLSGEPGAAIVQAASEQQACCIVTGSRGLGTVRRTLIGSVSDYILHHAHCPVLVCRHKDHKPSGT